MMIAFALRSRGERGRERGREKKNKNAVETTRPIPRGPKSSQTHVFPERDKISEKQTHLEKTPTGKRARERVADACISSLRGGVWMRVREPVKACARDVVKQLRAWPFQ